LKNPSLILAALIALTAASAPPVIPSLRVYSAGSMTGALGAMLKRYTLETGQKVDLVTGPAGALRERIEKGEAADLFVSANMAHPQRLAAKGKAETPLLFARNRICVIARHDVGLTSANLLDTLLNPRVGIGTSTPGSDPGGDYAWALFDKAETVHTGAAAILKAKARQLVGGPSSPPVRAGANAVKYFMANHTVDVFIGYCSSHDPVPDTDVDKVELPSKLAIRVDYGMVVLKGTDMSRTASTERLAHWLLTPTVQSMMLPYGFTPRNAGR
jgi:molybdate transport system substrate-binding protein